MEKNILIQNLTGKGEEVFNENVTKEEKILVKIRGYSGQGLVITSKKLYIIKWGFFTGNPFAGKCIAFNFKDITGLEIRKGIEQGKLEVLSPATQNIQGGQQDFEKDNIVTFIKKEKYDLFQEAVNIARELITKSREEGNDSLNQLEKLAELKEKGIITEEEFILKKKQILGI